MSWQISKEYRRADASKSDAELLEGTNLSPEIAPEYAKESFAQIGEAVRDILRSCPEGRKVIITGGGVYDQYGNFSWSIGAEE